MRGVLSARCLGVGVGGADLPNTVVGVKGGKRGSFCLIPGVCIHTGTHGLGLSFSGIQSHCSIKPPCLRSGGGGASLCADR